MIIFDPAAWFWVPLIVAIVPLALLMGARRPATVVVLGDFSLGLILLSLVATAWWTWLLKDGMGSDAVTTTGGLAWRRFAEQFAGPLLIAAVVAGVVLAVCRWRLRVGGTKGATDDAARELFGQ